MLMLMQMQCNYGAKHLRCYRLAVAEALSKSAKEWLCGSRLCSMGSEGSTPPSEGIPPSSSSSASNMSEGVLRKRLEPWPCIGLLLDIPYSVYSRAVVEPRSRANFQTLEVCHGLGARGSFVWKCPLVGLPSDPLGARLFRRGAGMAW
jgi:hypothetical protein